MLKTFGSEDSFVIANEDGFNVKFCGINACIIEAHNHEGGSEAVSDRAVVMNDGNGEQIIHDGVTSFRVKEVREFFSVEDFEAFIIARSDDGAVMNMYDESRFCERFKWVTDAYFP